MGDQPLFIFTVLYVAYDYRFWFFLVALATFICYASSYCAEFDMGWAYQRIGLGWVRSGRFGKSGDFSQQLIKKVILNVAVLHWLNFHCSLHTCSFVISKVLLT